MGLACLAEKSKRRLPATDGIALLGVWLDRAARRMKSCLTRGKISHRIILCIARYRARRIEAP